MEQERKDFKMLMPTLIMGALALALLFTGYYKGNGLHLTGMKIALKMLVQVLPLLFFAFIVAGMVQAMVPSEVLSKWIGEHSGIKGILIGTVTGGFAPGGPLTSLPIAAVFLRSGASIGTIVAFMTAWSLWAVCRMPIEIGILGWKFALIRFASTFFFPPIAGLIAQTIFGK